MIISLVLILVVSTVASPSQQTVGVSAEAERQQDTYAVYSALFDNLGSIQPVYFIESKTVSLQEDLVGYLGRLMFQRGCVAIPAGNTDAWGEVLTEFNSRKGGPGTLDTSLKIAAPYVLVNETESQEISKAIQGGTTAQDPKLRGARDVFTLGEVFFDRKRTLALTYLSADSALGNNSPSPGWVILEKGADGKWQQRSKWVTCSMSLSR